MPVNPASIAKLATTFAALDLLGPAFTWATPVYVDGSVRDGTLHGNLYIRGEGDPKLVAERLWLLLRRVQGLGIRSIAGDIVLDRSAFETAAADPGAFDGEPLRPYNAAPDALLLNFKSVVMTFTPQGGQAQVHLEPPLAGVQWPASVPLAAGDCNDWRGGLKADFSDPSRVRFAGGYPAACGEQVWPVAYADPRSYAARAVAGLWQQMGGSLTGQVRDGRVPAGLAPAFELRSPAAGRDRSRRQQVQQQRDGAATVPDPEPAAARAWARWKARARSCGSGGASAWAAARRRPSATARACRARSASPRSQLARLLQTAWASPLMPELMSSLPVTGVDGTLRRVARQRRRPGPPEDRQPARRDRRRGLCARRQRQALCRWWPSPTTPRPPRRGRRSRRWSSGRRATGERHALARIRSATWPPS